jgi:hypothetical protein
LSLGGPEMGGLLAGGKRSGLTLSLGVSRYNKFFQIYLFVSNS